MAFTAKALADGQLATTAGGAAIFTATVTTYVKKLTLFNTNAASQTIVLYINFSGTNRSFRRYVLAQNESADVLIDGESILLSAGDSIQATTTTATAVDYTVAGVEES